MSAEQRVTDDEWQPMSTAPKGEPTENVGCRDASEWFEGKPDTAKYPFGAPYVVIRRRAWPQEESWECNGEAYYVPDYFIGWRPLRTAHRATEAKLRAALAEVERLKHAQGVLLYARTNERVTLGHYEILDVYRAMIAARPTPPAASTGRG